MMKEKENDISYKKHEEYLITNVKHLLNNDVWEGLFKTFYNEFKHNGIKRSDLIYNFLVNFNFGSELFSKKREFYLIEETFFKINKGMRIRLTEDTNFYTNKKTRFQEIDKFILMLNKLKLFSLKEGINKIDFNKTISKNIFNFSKEKSNIFLRYFHKKTNHIYYYEFESIEVNGEKKFINRVWCRANIIRNQELCSVSPLRYGKGESY